MDKRFEKYVMLGAIIVIIAALFKVIVLITGQDRYYIYMIYVDIIAIAIFLIGTLVSVRRKSKNGKEDNKEDNKKDSEDSNKKSLFVRIIEEIFESLFRL